MTNEKILTDAEIITIGHQARAIEPGGNGYILPVTFARAIEQAVLQSEQVQAWKRDAERYRWLRTQCEKPIGGLTICEVGSFDLKPWSGDDPDHYIDAAMEKQK